MGCWNDTCMISHLPILSGEKCTAVLLLEQQHPYAGTSPTGEYMAIAAIHGEYDEYGQLENMDPTEESTLLSALSKLTLLIQSGGEMIDYKPNTLRGFIGTAINDELFISGKNGLRLSIQVVFLKDRMAALARPGDDSGLLNAAFADGAKLPLYTLMNTLAGGRWHPAMSPFLTAYAVANREVAYRSTEQILALTRLLLHLRMGWHVPCGRGSLEDVSEDMRRLADAYAEELESIDAYLDCE